MSEMWGERQDSTRDLLSDAQAHPSPRLGRIPLQIQRGATHQELVCRKEQLIAEEHNHRNFLVLSFKLKLIRLAAWPMPPSDAEELFMTKAQYEVFEALNPFFRVVMEGLWGLVDGNHYFDTFAEDAL